MNGACEPYRSRMLDLISENSSEGSGDLGRHLEECPACREYMEKLRADDVLLTEFANATRPAMDRIEEAVLQFLGNPIPTDVASGNRRSWFTVAAMIAVVSLVGLARFFGPLAMSTPTLAQTLAAMQTRPWVHSTTTIRSAGETQIYEDWQCFGIHVKARKTPGGIVEYMDFPENTAYRYNPASNKITISFVTDTYMTPGPKSAFEMLSEVVELAQRTGGTVARQPVTERGRRMERIHLSFQSDPYPRWVEVIRDVEGNLLVRMEQGDGKEDESRVSITFDYPDMGPADIYALGVPTDAAVFDIRPEGPALTLVHEIQERFERGVGDYLAVILESEIIGDHTLSPRRVSILRQKGDFKRADHYCASDFGRAETLYSLIQADWPSLTIPQVLTLVTDDALEWRMFFDGRRTVRYRRNGGELVRDEKPVVDEFMISGMQPFVHTLTDLIWPNLHLMIQMGSSHLKREVRLLPDDPNRPGLVGLQFVRFAETEDFWFDPDCDYALVERLHTQQHVDTRREFVKEFGQTATGVWYPQVIEGESTIPGPNGVPERTWRWERRVLVESNPDFDDAVFDSPTPTR